MNKKIKFLISFLVSIIVLYFIFSKIDFIEILKFLGKANIFFVLAGLIVYCLIVFFRALRFTALFEGKITAKDMLSIVLVHNFMTNVLPLKIGELSFPYLVAKVRPGTLGKSLFSLILVRVFDFVVLSCMLLIGVAYSPDLPQEIMKTLLFFIVLLSFIILSVFSAIIFHEKLASWIDKIKIEQKLMHMIRGKAVNFLRYFSALKSPYVLIGSFIFTWLIFISGFVTTMLILYSMGYTIKLSILLILLPLTALSSVIPINGIAGLGAYEGVWAAVLTFYGYSLETSLLLGFSTHLIQIAYLFVTGSAGWLASGKLIYGNRDSRD